MLTQIAADVDFSARKHYIYDRIARVLEGASEDGPGVGLFILLPFTLLGWSLLFIPRSVIHALGITSQIQHELDDWWDVNFNDHLLKRRIGNLSNVKYTPAKTILCDWNVESDTS